MSAIDDMRLPLQPEGWYHIYNRGNEGRTIFFETENHRYFLSKYAAYMSAYWDTYAYCLLPNHFHLAVQVKDTDSVLAAAQVHFKKIDKPFWKQLIQDLPNLEDLANQQQGADLLNLKDLVNLLDGQGCYRLATHLVSERFRHFLLGYAKAVNKQQTRTGSLFQKIFRRLSITSDGYMTTLIGYIHRNPLHHGICQEWADYDWSSYRSFLSHYPTLLKRAEVLEWFEGKESFIQLHQAYTDNWKEIEGLIIE